ncbi:MAG: SAM-dependent methyltransferase, partial [Verrucomicrobiales bacterium]
RTCPQPRSYSATGGAQARAELPKKWKVFYTVAEDYKHRRQSKHRAEVVLVKKAIKYLEKGKVLDAPCGNGRMAVLLAEAGFQVTGVDLSDATLAVSREVLASRSLDGTILKQDLEVLEFGDNEFEGTLCFRFFHHLPNDEVKARVIGELCRVTRKTFLISYMSPWSPTMIKRRVRHALGGKKSVQHATKLMDLKALIEPRGFEFRQDLAQSRWFHSLHLACFTAKGG